MTYFFHTCLLMILFTIFSIQDKIKPNIKSIGKFIIFTIIIVLFNYSISNSHLLWMFALINIVFYGSFVQFIFHKNLTDDSGNLKITNLDRLIFTKNGELTI